MSDPIERQAAIDAASAADYAGMSVEDVTKVTDEVVKAIKALPTAPPDIIVCGDCKHWICHDKRCGYWNHGVKPLMWCSQAERREDV